MAIFNNVSKNMQELIYALPYHMAIFIKNATITGDSKGGLIIKDYRPSVSLIKGRKYEISQALKCSIYWDDGTPRAISTKQFTAEQIDDLLNRVGQRSNSVPTDALNMEKWD